MQLGMTRPTQLPWLPVLANVAPLACQTPPVLAEQNVTPQPSNAVHQLLANNLTLTVVTSDGHVVQLVDAQSNLTHTLSFLVVANVQSTFAVEACHVGIARLLLHVYTDDNVTLATVDYAVRVVRQNRAVDRMFNLGVLGQALFNAFALGCGADWQRIKRHLADNLADFLSPFLQQVVILPAVRQPEET